MIKQGLKGIMGTALLLLLGFLAYCVVTGFGVIIALILVILPAWQIVLGTVLGSFAIFLYLMDKDK